MNTKEQNPGTEICDNNQTAAKGDYKREAGETEGWMAMRNRSVSMKLSRAEILYLEQSARYVIVRTDREEIRLPGRTRDMYQRLGTTFHLCHTYLAVNLERIRKMQGGMILFDTGDELPLAKRSFAHTRRAFDRYLAIVAEKEEP